jgi:predicted TPR repeat methyltransferase
MSLLGKLKLAIKRRLYDNRSHWNERYATNIELGSGHGSRGEIREYKRDLIAKAMQDHGLTSVIDLGCGDIEIIRELDIPRYRGIDLSDVVVERNRTLRPDWTFEAGDITTADTSGTWDMTLCLDVLIHQNRRKAYSGIIETIGRIGSSVVLVSGYETAPSGWNVFFHEKLSETLARDLPALKFEHVGSYRDTDLFMGIRK